MSYTPPEMVVSHEPGAAVREAILTPLVAYNESHAPPHGFQPLAILLRDPDTGETLGGLWGRSVYDWIVVELLVVPERWRGQKIGTALLRRAEAIGRERGYVGVWLDTYEFQARGFYEKNGFEILGTLDDHPRGSRRYFLRKRLEQVVGL